MRIALFGICLAGMPCLAPASAAEAAPQTIDEKVYDLDFTATLVPETSTARVRIQVRQPRDFLREVRFSIDPGRHHDFAGDGQVTLDGETVTWVPPKKGGSFTYTVNLNHQRKSGAFDSKIESRWALFRGDDLVPPASVTALKGARSRSRLRLTGPGNWSFLSPYPKDKQGWFTVDWPERGFDRPVGWMVAGKLSVRWADINGVRVAVAGPRGQGVRSMDILAFLRWNLPVLLQIFPDFQERILIVSAGDPMWRGGLSGPNSLFLHADRPLISANGTSTMLHELMHIAQGYSAEGGDDWIVEGIAEFYTLEIMQRSGTLSRTRYRKGHEQLDAWGDEVSDLQADSSSGARTARAVGIMQALDAELREGSKNVYSLDEVVRRLSLEGEPVTLERLRQVSMDLVGKPLESLADSRIQG
ncbi:MAG: hypothetical protein MUP90_08900, partial [Gammaproteobacteria bacterium]|nr:hypothetical protein [Gammaproteobacteria bacterium]